MLIAEYQLLSSSRHLSETSQVVFETATLISIIRSSFTEKINGFLDIAYKNQVEEGRFIFLVSQ